MPPQIIRALNTIRNSLRADEGEGEMPLEEARPVIPKDRIAILAARPEPCPESDLPKLAADRE
ncbi:MAG: hypothetical protein LPJ93_14595 [Rhodobacterales bacterium]|nr:hypothetical protein [Rhodobacterales bacterium]